LADWERYRWADEATESTVAVVPGDPELPLARLGRVEDLGVMDFAAAQALQNGFYGDGTFTQRAVIQAERVGDAWGLVEPNGFRARGAPALLALAAGGRAGSFFWNVNGMMVLLLVDGGEVIAECDPLLGPVPDLAHDLPFEDQPGASSMALLTRHTGVAIAERWFAGEKATYIVHTAAG
jgi:hypothetical protein